MKQLVFATHNAHKLDEIRHILGSRVEVRSLGELGCTEEIDETADTLEGNALQKARYVYEKYGCDCFADDSGLEVDALGGLPGVHTARYAPPAEDQSEANTQKLLRVLKDEENRSARFRTIIALIEGGEEHLFEGIVEGYITTEKRGNGGFGYDPVFVPKEETLTFAELGADYKNQISHRANAVKKLCQYLAENHNENKSIK
ncbi:MAG: non-canonical purine NTP diphosphatase [Alloprevotella sp.]|nr:non-canonical purine NTP diphosphatase [Alloprevotella sp.]